MYYDECTVKSYRAMEIWFSNAKTPTKGRPLKGWARVFKVDNTYEVRASRWKETLIATYYPDDTIVMGLTPQHARWISPTLSSALHRAIPISWTRKATGVYSVQHNQIISNWMQTNPSWYSVSAQGYEYFEGIKFDLATGECLNPKPNIILVPNTDARLLWLRASRAFKHGIKVRARMGVLDALCKQVSVSSDDWQKPDWHNDVWVSRLYNDIKDKQFSKELLLGFVMSSNIGFWRNERPTTETTIEAVNNVLRELSMKLRVKFGVFPQE